MKLYALENHQKYVEIIISNNYLITTNIIKNSIY